MTDIDKTVDGDEGRMRRTVLQRLDDARPRGPIQLAAPELETEARYRTMSGIGAGGMGEVKLCLDHRIGREVAMKSIHPDHAKNVDSRARFFREARVQGQLEHPAIVPVYDLDVTANGPWFTMKRIRGLTFAEIVDAMRAGDPDAIKTYTLRRLLTAMSTVSLAVAFAHARGIVHRDLKPSNIMVGAFGEVHVLDWGLAKVIGENDPISVKLDTVLGGSGKTIAGDVMGTVGYMAPEQASGQVESIDERTDVYALGAILFELLTLEPLHVGARPKELIASTLRGEPSRPSERTPHREIAPELDAIVVQATARLQSERFASARELSEAIDRFLDGHQDLERRRAIADEHAKNAAEAADKATTGDDSARARALREAGAALAVDARHRGALEALVRVLLTPPKALPAEAMLALAERRRTLEQSSARGSFLLYATWVGFVPVLLTLGVRSWPLFWIGLALVVAAAGGAWLAWKNNAGPNVRLAVYAVGSTVVLLTATLLGSLILVPNLALTNVLAYMLYGDRRHRSVAIGLGVVIIALPLALQIAGVFPASYSFRDGAMTIQPHLASLPEWGTLALLFFASVALVLAPAIFIGRVRDDMSAAEERAFLHAWNLEQILPEEARNRG